MSITKASGFVIMSMIMIKTTSLEDQMVNLTKLVERLLISPNVKDHEIAK